VRLPLAFLVLSACAGAPAAPPDKPHAPVDVTVTDRPLGGDLHELTVTGVALADLPSLDLELAGQRLTGGAVRRGGQRSLVVRVRAADGAELVAGARTAAGTRAVSLRLGPEPPPAQAPRVVVTPFGPAAEAGP
jgi:hypothetical protein